MLSLIKHNDNLSVSQLRDTFKRYEFNHSYPRREHYLQKINKLVEVVDFTWRKDQKEVIEAFLQFEKQTYIVHAVFGSGKTTLLLGMLIHGIIHDLFLPSEVMFVSFNISIKNEIKRKLTKFGIGSKVTVRTFDSIIYQICKNTEYPHIDLPNFDGKRRHVYNKIFDEDCTYEISYQPKIIFIDECQDLEKTTMEVFKRFYPNSKFVLAGDIFQSIQKEPRESVLWHYMNKEDDDIYKIYMSETPRVPEKNLNTLKKALSTYYPEFSDKINNWHSSNKVSDADIEWRRLESYTHMFDDLEQFCKDHPADETMILTFSSAITVKGAMGDVARFRRFLSMNDIHVNKNHKKMSEKDYFLTTANSSKGLERDYVIVFLTFPLEKAFINLSDDIVVNLITVALTRAKKKVIMYVPKYEDKFSRVLKIFDACPKPTEKIREDKSLTEFEIYDFLNLEHTVTELIRQSIIKYDTRILLKESVKVFNFEKLFDNNIPVYLGIQTEEEKAFVGVLIENLITSTWSGVWPFLSDYHVNNNPMYNHCSKKIKTLTKKYQMISKKSIQDINIQFEGICCYSQLQMALCNKIYFNITEENRDTLFSYWLRLKPKALQIRPTEGNIKIQSNMKMKLLTGVADTVITTTRDDNKSEITIVEIKASQDREWKDDALIQAMLYALMSGKTWSRLILLNPFMNEKVSYYFNMKNILTLRNFVFQDIMMFNINCMLAKKSDAMSKKEKLRVENCMFLEVAKNDLGDITQVSLLRMESPIKCQVLLNKYVTKQKEEEDEIDRKIKLQYESKNTLEEIKKEIDIIVNNPLYNNEQDVVVYCRQDTDLVMFDRKKFFNIPIEVYDQDEELDDNDKTNKKNLAKIENYDSLSSCAVFISKMFQMYNFY
jgi:hypothetical protein